MITTMTAVAADAARRNALVSGHEKLIWNIIYRHFPDLVRIAGPDEVFQEAYLGALEAAGRFDPAKGYKFTTFLYRSVWGKLHDYVRRQRRAHTVSRARIALYEPALMRDRATDTRHIPHAADEGAERAAYLTHRLLGLTASARERGIVTAYYGLAGRPPQPFAAVAREVGTTPHAVRMLVLRVRDQIREMGRAGELGPDLAEWCGGDGDPATDETANKC